MSTKLEELMGKMVGFLKRREVVLFFIFFIVVSLSFGLGYLYAEDQNVAPIIIEKNC